MKLGTEIVPQKSISIIGLVDDLVESAYSRGASDIHIDPTHDKVRIRFRIDGVLQDIQNFPKNIHSEVIARIKILSKLRTDEHHATQDGRFRHEFGDNQEFVDIRVSIAPTYHGENSVLRLLTDKKDTFDLSNLGFSDSDKTKIMQALKKPSGMILATGPTGSGKTTTLYTMIKMLNSKDISIITIEDPVEYAVSDIEQIQVNPRTGLTFATGLRSILRQDPNIIMVGEIRDSETAGIAINTALTGHLLLSTLHTNDAATTLPRLLDMGIEPYLVASTINICIGQRLVRKNCIQCKVEIEVTQTLRESLNSNSLTHRLKDGQKLFRGNGCTACGGTGYAGRLCINEILVADDEIREAILHKAPAIEIRKIAVKNGMTTMLEDGMRRVEAGETTIEEVLRVIHE